MNINTNLRKSLTKPKERSFQRAPNTSKTTNDSSPAKPPFSFNVCKTPKGTIGNGQPAATKTTSKSKPKGSTTKTGITIQPTMTTLKKVTTRMDPSSCPKLIPSAPAKPKLRATPKKNVAPANKTNKKITMPLKNKAATSTEQPNRQSVSKLKPSLACGAVSKKKASITGLPSKNKSQHIAPPQNAKNPATRTKEPARTTTTKLLPCPVRTAVKPQKKVGCCPVDPHAPVGVHYAVEQGGFFTAKVTLGNGTIKTLKGLVNTYDKVFQREFGVVPPIRLTPPVGLSAGTKTTTSCPSPKPDPLALAGVQYSALGDTFTVVVTLGDGSIKTLKGHVDTFQKEFQREFGVAPPKGLGASKNTATTHRSPSARAKACPLVTGPSNPVKSRVVASNTTTKKPAIGKKSLPTCRGSITGTTARPLVAKPTCLGKKCVPLSNATSKKAPLGLATVPPSKTTSKKPVTASNQPSTAPLNTGTNVTSDVVDEYADVDNSKWKFSELKFAGSVRYAKMGRSEEVKGVPIAQGITTFKANPGKYLALSYQTDAVEWPEENQSFTYVHRTGTVGYKPQGVSTSGWKTLLLQEYQRLPPFKNNVLSVQYRDKYTDTMTHCQRMVHSECNKPILPGRGMGVCDAPNLKIIGDVDPSDIHQGSVGDCWLLSGISSLAEFDGAVKRLFRKTKNLDAMPLDGPNQYTITLWDLTTWTEVDIVVDERLCVMADGSGRLLASKPSEDGELWVCYLEKALAAHCGGWDKITGGQCTHAWALLTGCKEQYTIRKNQKTGKYGCYARYNPFEQKWAVHGNSPQDSDGRMWRVAWPEVGGGGDMHKELDEEELFMKLYAWDQVNYIVGAGTSSSSDKHSAAGMINNHAYSVIECVNDVAGTDIDLIKVRNPWGSGEIEDGLFDDDGPGWDQYPQIRMALNPVEADDGIFWVTKQEFFQIYQTIYLSASNMTDFLED